MVDRAGFKPKVFASAGTGGGMESSWALAGIAAAKLMSIRPTKVREVAANFARMMVRLVLESVWGMNAVSHCDYPRGLPVSRRDWLAR